MFQNSKEDRAFENIVNLAQKYEMLQNSHLWNVLLNLIVNVTVYDTASVRMKKICSEDIIRADSFFNFSIRWPVDVVADSVCC